MLTALGAVTLIKPPACWWCLTHEAQKTIREVYQKYILITRGLGFDSRLYRYAQSLVSDDKDLAKSVLENRSKEEPLNLAYEEVKLTDSLTHLVEVFGANNRLFNDIIGSNSPSLVAHRLVYDSVLRNINNHKAIVNGTSRVQVTDPMIELARFIKTDSAQYHSKMSEASEKERRGYAKISDVLFKKYGTDRYPDATFTLRLSFGTVNGYEENGKVMPAWTTIGDAYRHALEFDNAGDHKLPARWWAKRKFVNQRTPLNFVSDLDITGGNSGSPVFNENLEIVGLVFDSNIHGLVSDYDYKYSEDKARAVAVHSAGIVEILDKIYKADRIVKELTGR